MLVELKVEADAGHNAQRKRLLRMKRIWKIISKHSRNQVWLWPARFILWKEYMMSKLIILDKLNDHGDRLSTLDRLEMGEVFRFIESKEEYDYCEDIHLVVKHVPRHQKEIVNLITNKSYTIKSLDQNQTVVRVKATLKVIQN